MTHPAKTQNNMDCRHAAVIIINKVGSGNASLATLLPEYIRKTPEADHALLQELCYGSLRHYFSLKSIVTRYLEKPLRKKDSDILSLLILGAYQLLHTRIPDHAAINSTVRTTEAIGKDWSKGLVNAILRNIQRDRNEPQALSNPSDAVSYYDHPQWLIDKIRLRYPDAFDLILRANNEKAPLTFRVNISKSTRDYCLAALSALDIRADATSISPYGIRINQSINLAGLSLFNDGLVSVQDEAAQLAAPLLDLTENMHILDACAAPGGKTCHILEIQPTSKVTAIDRNPERCELIRSNVQRLQQRANIFAADAANPDQWWKTHCDAVLFDRILVDAPCSATGVIRHHPDIKLLRQAGDIAGLHDIQLKILHALWQLLKHDGILLYTTCSILEEENDAVIREFMNTVTDAHIEPITASWGAETSHGRQLLPAINAHDGFYFSKIRRL